MTILYYCLTLIILSFLAYLFFRYKTSQGKNYIDATAIKYLFFGLVILFSPRYLLEFFIKEFIYPKFNIPTSPVWDLIVFLIFSFSILMIVYFRGNRKHGEEDIKNDSKYLLPNNEEIKLFCQSLFEELKTLDIETTWEEKEFIYLDVKALLEDSNGNVSVVKNLNKSFIQKKNVKASLIIGEPGSGKSITLRTLCKELLSQRKIERIPIYINLREWQTSKNPTPIEFKDFIKDNLTFEKSPLTNDFIEKYFEHLYKKGHFIFFFDSFDEIPFILDTYDKSAAIDNLSDTIFKSLGANKCVLASREFKKPTRKFQANQVLHIQPLTEYKVYKLLKKELSSNQIKAIYNRPNLRPLVKNPFTANLIKSYVKNEKYLPENQFQLYQHWIQSHLNESQLKQENLSTEIVFDTCTAIAALMFDTPEYGLDILLNDLEKELPEYRVNEVIPILQKAKLIRIGKGRFSFIHRKINEYFVALSIQKKGVIQLDEILKNSRNRDALIVYCEIVDDETAKKIVNYCFQHIQEILYEDVSWESEEYKHSLNALRFLSDAFRSRKNVLEDIYTDFVELLEWQTRKGQNLIYKKHAIEATVLLHQEDAEMIIEREVSMDKNYSIDFDGMNQYLSNSIISSSKYLKTLSKNLSTKLIFHFANIKNPEIGYYTHPINLKRRINYLMLSKAFDSIRTFLKLWLIEQILLLLIVTVIAFKLILSMEFSFIGFFIIIMLCILPIYSWFLPIFSLTYNFYVRKKQSLMTGAILIFGITLIGIYGTYQNPEFPKDFHFFILQLITGFWFNLFIGLFTIWAIYLSVRLHNENRKIRKLNRTLIEEAKLNTPKNSERKTIAYYFYKLPSGYYRLQYVNYLKTKEVQPLGDWPEGKLPNRNDDEASGNLAELEEKWLGLD